MKKMLFLTLAVLILAMVMTPTGGGLVQAQTLSPSYYSSNAYGDFFGTTPSRVQSFNVQQNGVVTLEGDLFNTSYTGLINVSGMCEAKCPECIQWMKLRIILRDNPYFYRTWPVYHGPGWGSFNVTFPAEPFYIEGWQTGVGAVRARCVVLVEPVP